MHLYWVQSETFWQQEAARCPLQEKAMCCSKWLWDPWRWPHTNTVSRGAHTSAHLCLRSGRTCQGKETQQEETGKGHYGSTEKHPREECCRWEAFLGDQAHGVINTKTRTLLRDWPTPGQGPHTDKTKHHMDLTLTTCISTPYISSHLALFK